MNMHNLRRIVTKYQPLLIIKNYSTKYQENKIIINNQTINYLKTGKGNHVLLCCPGALGTIWSDFKPQVENLDKEKFTVIAWDPPGYGKSSPPKRQFSLDFYDVDAKFAQLLMQHLQIERYSLLGWSDGSISCMIHAANHPNEVSNLIVWGGNSYYTQEEINSFEIIRDTSKWSKKAKAPLVEMYGEDGLQQMWSSWCDAVINIFKTNKGDVCKEKLKLIVCPTLILHGDKDPMIASEHPTYLQQNINGSVLHRFPDGKHNIHLRYAENFNKIVSEFILKSKM